VTFGLPHVTSAEHFSWQRYAKEPDRWFESAEARRIAANVLSHQSPLGCWPKNLDTSNCTTTAACMTRNVREADYYR
jgi:hypothetical protein